MSSETPNVLILIPCYREQGRIGDVVRDAVALGHPVVVIDDGSDDDTAAEAEAAGARVIRHDVNQGKGKAVATGLTHAQAGDWDAIVMLDGDGQHLPGEIGRFIDKFKESKPDLIVGTRMADTATMPFVRRCTNRFMSWLISRQLGCRISDTQCGYRLIARRAFPVALACTSGGFSAESEILLQLALQGYTLGEVPISTVYGTERSSIRPVRDTLKFIKMLAHFRKQRRRFRADARRSASQPDSDTDPTA
ncbi:MAG: glycosyltransferase family 2 protein [Kiritimatiellia bacterium]|jgi:glycosyltransferase involved in cell wall biosynthesis